jgi:hypothetical protein
VNQSLHALVNVPNVEAYTPRMATRTTVLLFAIVVVLSSTRASAHHHIGCANDTENAEMVTGRITQIDWMNPHVHIHVASAVPGFTEWNIETRAAYIMRREGLPQSAFKIGDTIHIMLWRAKDGSRQGFTKSITLSDGRTHAFNIAELRCPW